MRVRRVMPIFTRHPARMSTAFAAAVAAFAFIFVSDAPADPASKGKGAAASQSGSDSPARAGEPELPHVRVDVEARAVHIDARVKHPEVAWVEVGLCTPRGPAHETLLITDARPRDVHLALLLIGLEPGAPQRAEQQPDGTFRALPPHGPACEVLIQTLAPAKKRAEGQTSESPRRADSESNPNPASKADPDPQTETRTDGRTDQAENSNATRRSETERSSSAMVKRGEPTPLHMWIEDQRTGEPMPAPRWVFAGSRFVEVQGRERYAADLSGTILSIVNFGNEVVARRTRTTNRTDAGRWVASADRMPPAGAPVVLTIRALDEDEAEPEAEDQARASRRSTQSEDEQEKETEKESGSGSGSGSGNETENE